MTPDAPAKIIPEPLRSQLVATQDIQDAASRAKAIDDIQLSARNLYPRLFWSRQEEEALSKKWASERAARAEPASQKVAS